LKTKSGNQSFGFKHYKSQSLRVNTKERSHVATLMKSKRSEAATINIVQAQVEEIYFIFNFEYMFAALSREMSLGLQTKSQCSLKYLKPKRESLRDQNTFLSEFKILS
jgi:hypothetical protein